MRSSWDRSIGSDIDTESNVAIPRLVPALFAGALVHAAYLTTHPEPAYGAGLYLVMAEEIARNDFLLPQTVTGYTPNGIPFAYPPLMLYVLAFLMEATTLSGTQLARYLPGIATTLSIVPTYLLARAILDSEVEAGIAAFLIAVSPPILHWHLSAGGVVRAPAFLITTTGMYVGYRLFDGDRSYLLPATVLFALTLLTHPVYATAFGLTYLCMFAFRDRTLRGLAHGVTVAGGGFLLVSPWLLVVITRHGVETFASASGTHGGLGGRVPDLLAGRGVESVLFTGRVETLLESSPLGLIVMTAWLGLILLVVVHTAADRNWFLPGWFLVIGVIVWKARFAFLIGSIALATFLTGASHELARRTNLSTRTTTIVLVAVACTTAGVVGFAYATSSLESRPGSETLQPYADSQDTSAMRWAARNTPPTSTFVVVGDAAEWFPYHADRPILVGHWGQEWTTTGSFNRHYGMETRLSSCPTAACIESTLQRNRLTPDYLYVPTDAYLVHAKERRPPPDRFQSLLDSNRFNLVYRSDDVAIFEVNPGPSASSTTNSPLRAGAATYPRTHSNVTTNV